MAMVGKRVDAGFTLIELIVVGLLIGVITAIAAPSWVAIVTRQRLYDARANALTKIREAQAQAIRTARPWEACFRDSNGYVEVSVQPSGLTNNCQNHKNWQPLLDAHSDKITISLHSSETLGNAINGYSFRFNLHGDRIIYQGDLIDDNGESKEVSEEYIVFGIRNQEKSPFYCISSQGIIGNFIEGKLNLDTKKSCQ
ncbi:MAG: prepilin-type N-terminal cleavage/methylation domain-containing protein [Gloeomargarita sp. HHBFW_bins_162]